MNTHSRRTVLRAAGLAALAAAAAPALAGCGAQQRTLAAAAGVVRSRVARRAPRPDAIPDGVAAVDHLAAVLYPAMATGGGNLAYSPFSVALALAMAANGAVGATQRQMLTALGGASIDTLDAGMNALVPHLTGLAAGPTTGASAPGRAMRPPTLQIADALFGQSGLTWKKPFLDVLAEDYGAGLYVVDFAGATEQATATVNQWTSEHTGGKIPQIVPPGAVSPQTALILVNALHFKASWLQQFDAPSMAPFRRAAGTPVSVPMLRGGTGSAYGEGPGWQVVSLPYAGGGFAMSLVVPGAPDGLPAIESQVAADGVGPLLARLRPAAGSVTLPVFAVRSATSLATWFIAHGMSLPFGAAADFSAMTDDEALMIGDVLHEAVVEVDRNGTEAAAATAVTIEPGMATVATPYDVVADRPFLFVIHDVDRRTPLFVGRVTDPTSSSPL